MPLWRFSFFFNGRTARLFFLQIGKEDIIIRSVSHVLVFIFFVLFTHRSLVEAFLYFKCFFFYQWPPSRPSGTTTCADPPRRLYSSGLLFFFIVSHVRLCQPYRLIKKQNAHKHTRIPGAPHTEQTEAFFHYIVNEWIQRAPLSFPPKKTNPPLLVSLPLKMRMREVAGVG